MPEEEAKVAVAIVAGRRPHLDVQHEIGDIHVPGQAMFNGERTGGS